MSVKQNTAKMNTSWELDTRVIIYLHYDISTIVTKQYN